MDRRLPIYQDADARTGTLSAASGLHCPPGCGVCCEQHNPHVTVNDMADIARSLVQAGRGEAALTQAREQTICIFYQAGRLPGGCTIYAQRPLLCRLFGYAAVRDKHGALELAVCHVHKEVQSAEAERARAWIADGNPVAVFADLQAPMDALDPTYATERMPINEALARALERDLLRAQFAGG